MRELRSRYGNLADSNCDFEVLLEEPEAFPLMYLYSLLLVALRLSGMAGKNRSFQFKPKKVDRWGIPNRPNRLFNSVFGVDKSSLNRKFAVAKRRMQDDAFRLFQSIRGSSDLISLVFDHIHIGSLVYDTYLRKKQTPVLDMGDPDLVEIICEALAIVKISSEHFEKNRVSLVVVGDIAYIYSGIICRVAAKYNIPSLTMNLEGNSLVRLDTNEFLRIRNFIRYREDFQALFSTKGEKERALSQAQESLNEKLSGEVNSLYYMNSSSFGGGIDYKLSPTGFNVIIFFHCFFDSPHIYRSMVFDDFYEWVTNTFDIAKETNYNWYAKPHPNGLPGNEPVISRLKEQYPFVQFIDSKVSNKKLFSQNLDAIISVYGTVIHEASYNNILAVSAGDNPHIAYDFYLKPTTREEYRDSILRLPELRRSVNINKSQIEEFYYMHYLREEPALSFSTVYPDQEYISMTNMKGLVKREQRKAYHSDGSVFKALYQGYDQDLMTVQKQIQTMKLVEKWPQNQ